MYRRTTISNGATANWPVPGAEFGTPVGCVSQGFVWAESLKVSHVVAQGFSFTILSDYTHSHTIPTHISQTQRHFAARGFATGSGVGELGG